MTALDLWNKAKLTETHNTRVTPRRLEISDYLVLIARASPGRVRRVPAKAFDLEGEDEIGDFAFILCPCGGRPVARPALEKCPGCERWYVFVRTGEVFVAYGAMEPPS